MKKMFYIVITYIFSSFLRAKTKNNFLKFLAFPFSENIYLSKVVVSHN